MTVFRLNIAAAWFLAALAVCIGCEKKSNTVTVTGSVLRGGQPLRVGPNGYVEVMLQPDLPPGEPFTPKMAECDKASGKFEIHEVTPGKYKVGVRQLDPDPTADKLNGAFVAASGKIIREVDGKTPLTIDLDKPK